MRRDSARLGRTEGLSDFLGQERRRILLGASPQRKEQMRAAERQREVYAAWNAVTAGTREAAHVTGLHYMPEGNELLVYLDTPAWTQEMTMLREILRGRMALKSVDVANLIFKTSRLDYEGRPSRPMHLVSRTREEKPPVPHAALSAAEEEALDAEVAPIEDTRLKDALKKAMKASFEWKKGSEGSNKA